MICFWLDVNASHQIDSIALKSQSNRIFELYLHFKNSKMYPALIMHKNYAWINLNQGSYGYFLHIYCSYKNQILNSQKKSIFVAGIREKLLFFTDIIDKIIVLLNIKE